MIRRNRLRFLLGPRERRLLVVDALLYGTAAGIVLWPVVQRLVLG